MLVAVLLAAVLLAVADCCWLIADCRWKLLADCCWAAAVRGWLLRDLIEQFTDPACFLGHNNQQRNDHHLPPQTNQSTQHQDLTVLLRPLTIVSSIPSQRIGVISPYPTVDIEMITK